MKRKKLSIAIVGPGRLGSALAINLKRAGFIISEIVSSNKAESIQTARQLARVVGARPAIAKTALLDADVIWFCVPDDKIKSAAQPFLFVSDWSGKLAVHSSGALTSDELNSVRERGASVASVHPMMSFVTGSNPSLKGVTFGLEGDVRALKAARRMVRALGGLPFDLDKRNKVLYHAWGTILSPLLIAHLVSAEQVAKAAGIPVAKARRIMLPIVRQTVHNYANLGPGNAFSGPIVRGDSAILRKHLKSLDKIPEAAQIYVALARCALRHLPTRNRKLLNEALKLG